MNFGQALDALKNGAYITRKGWNGKDMFLWLKRGTVIREEWCHDATLLKLAMENGGTIEALPTICMKTADNKVLTGWLASQTDMLSNDWEIYFKGTRVPDPMYANNKEYSDPIYNNMAEWNVPENEKVTEFDLDGVLREERFNDAIDKATEKVNSLSDKETNAEEVISDLKKQFKMENTEASLNHQYKEAVIERDRLSEIKASMQQEVMDYLKTTPKDKLFDELKQLEQLYLSKAETTEECAMIADDFNVFLGYAKNN